MSRSSRKKIAGRKQPDGARQGRRTPELSPEVKEVLRMLKALEEEPDEVAGLEQRRNLGRTVITD